MNAVSAELQGSERAPRSFSLRRQRAGGHGSGADGSVHRPHGAPLGPYVWRVALATFLVAVCPVLLVWWLRVSGVMVSSFSGMLLAIGLSLGASHLGRRFWEGRAASGDLLFAELMIWGFLRRWRHERRLASALELLGPMNDAQPVSGGLSAESQAKALERLGAALEATDPHIHGHSSRVAGHAWMIAKRMGASPEQVARIRTAAAVHDVGKIETPTSILRKAGPLSDEEFAVIKRHPVDGARMVAVLNDAELTSVVRHHHEHLDGTGYPSGLRGEEIPLGSRIIAVADTFDAITSARPYRAARPHRAAIEILKKEAGTQLDPAVVRVFCSLYSGRRPFLALWSSLASLPEQVFAWLGSGVVGVTSAARVLVVATLLGSVAATAPTLGLTTTRHQTRTHYAKVSVASSWARTARTTPGQRTQASKRPTVLRHPARPRVAVGPAAVGPGSPAPATGSTSPSGAASGAGSSSPSVAGTSQAPAPSGASGGASGAQAPSEVGGSVKLPAPIEGGGSIKPPAPVEGGPVKPPAPLEGGGSIKSPAPVEGGGSGGPSASVAQTAAPARPAS